MHLLGRHANTFNGAACGIGPLYRRRQLPYHALMAVYLDDEAVDLGEGDLAAVIAEAGRRLEIAGRIVVEVRVNGETVLPDTWQSGVTPDITGADVRLHTADPRDLSRSTLEALLAALDEVTRWQQQAAELLQHDQQSQAMSKLVQAMEVWQQSQQAVVQVTSLIGIELNDAEVEGESAGAIVQRVVDQLRTVRDAIQAGDMVSLADSLAYEWPDTTQKWQKLIGCVLEKIDRLA